MQAVLAPICKDRNGNMSDSWTGYNRPEVGVDQDSAFFFFEPEPKICEKGLGSGLIFQFQQQQESAWPFLK